MELLDEETWKFTKKYYLAMHHAFFTEPNYQGIQSHKEAVLAFLNYENRLWELTIWSVENHGNFTIEEHEQKYHEIKGNKELIYTDRRSFEGVIGYPVQVNPKMMQATQIPVTEFFAEEGEYAYAFLNNPQGSYENKEVLLKLNDYLFPDREELEIYSWNTDFTQIYNEGRESEAAYLWSIYDNKKIDLL